jgi:hypothetical protein
MSSIAGLSGSGGGYGAYYSMGPYEVLGENWYSEYVDGVYIDRSSTMVQIDPSAEFIMLMSTNGAYTYSCIITTRDYEVSAWVS